jgi:hypothetical protein
MLIFTTWALRCFGLSGILGAMLFMTGDLLYNHVPSSKASVAAKMGGLPEWRLLAAGTLGLIGCWFYMAGALHVGLALRPAGNVFAVVFLLAFEAVMVGYGVGHTAYFSIAAGAKTAEDADAGGRLGKMLFERLVAITYVPVGICSLMMLYAVITGQSLYPRWMALFVPIVLYVLKAPVVRILRGRARELVNDCYDNLVLLVFYVMSTIVLWNVAVA